ncbi:Phosducin-like protein 1 [Rhodotorula toruloides]|uniref:BY PROTMAP: gi/472586976/gb/EMS24475.1/ GTPase inhibitor [Rhodosporidium toruloides NP11] gi/647394840/emb/CDR36074.1/ RHTO0S01e13674g1_1 [Rhodosporidium toruloides] n=1 Tax=Rhodotorula toruloides TaxID=5286 RepID=A0A0K3CDP6_RHOTO|nr:Phosducin-like protein 1 [Rhodotorula toruloides]
MSSRAAASASTSSSIHRKPRTVERNSDDSDTLLEELEAELDDDFDLGGFREKRMLELKAQVDAARRMQESDYGKLTEIKVEKDLIARTAKEKRSVVHFFHRDFRRCKIMDAHLEKLAAKHLDTLFLKADVANVPFLVTKLDVKVLPCVIGFVDGVTKMKLVGFEDLPGGDAFTTASLELGMQQCEVLSKYPGSAAPFPSVQGTRRDEGGRRRIRTGARGDDSDLDD